MGHSYLEETIMKNSYLDEKNTGTQPLRAKTYWNTAI